jgi:hypothetical protein
MTDPFPIIGVEDLDFLAGLFSVIVKLHLLPLCLLNCRHKNSSKLMKTKLLYVE